MRPSVAVLVLFCLAGVGLLPAWAETPNPEEMQVLRNHIQELQAGQNALREELKAMKKGQKRGQAYLLMYLSNLRKLLAPID